MLEFKEQADQHQTICDVLKKQTTDMLAFAEQQKKDHKALQVPVEKAYKSFMDAYANSLKVRPDAMYMCVCVYLCVHCGIRMS